MRCLCCHLSFERLGKPQALDMRTRSRSCMFRVGRSPPSFRAVCRIYRYPPRNAALPWGIPCNLNSSAKVVRRPLAVESQSCAVPSQAWGYAGRPASLGATHAHNNDDIIAVAVQPGCFHLRECLRKIFLSSRGSCRQAVELGLPNIQAYRPGSNKRASGGMRRAGASKNRTCCRVVNSVRGCR